MKQTREIRRNAIAVRGGESRRELLLLLLLSLSGCSSGAISRRKLRLFASGIGRDLEGVLRLLMAFH